MEKLKSRGYYDLKTPEQWSLYDIAENASLWKKTLAGLSSIFLMAFLLMLAMYSADRTKHEAEVERANQRVLTMVEQLRQK